MDFLFFFLFLQRRREKIKPWFFFLFWFLRLMSDFYSSVRDCLWKREWVSKTFRKGRKEGVRELFCCRERERIWHIFKYYYLLLFLSKNINGFALWIRAGEVWNNEGVGSITQHWILSFCNFFFIKKNLFFNLYARFLLIN